VFIGCLFLLDIPVKFLTLIHGIVIFQQENVTLFLLDKYNFLFDFVQVTKISKHARRPERQHGVHQVGMSV
jgi:hypothetical protein